MCSFVLRCVALILAAAFPYLATFAQAAPVGSRVLYKQVDGHSLALYVDAPPAETSAHSAIVFFHGGAWTMGEVSQFNKQAAYLSSRGMTAIQVEYRLLDKKSSDSPRICVEDAKSAMRWVRSHAGEFGIDPGKLSRQGIRWVLPGCRGDHDHRMGCANGRPRGSPKGNVMVLFNPVMDGGPDGFGYKRFGELYRQYSPPTT